MQSMTPTEYVAAAIRTEHTPNFIVTEHGVAHDTMLARCLHALLGMMSELGELSGAFKSHLIYGKPLDTVNLVEELGDGDWYRALIADALQIGFEASWAKNIAKLRARYPDKFTADKALHRDLDAERRALEGVEGVPITIVLLGQTIDTNRPANSLVHAYVIEQLKQRSREDVLVDGFEVRVEKTAMLVPAKTTFGQLGTTTLQVTRATNR